MSVAKLIDGWKGADTTTGWWAGQGVVAARGRGRIGGTPTGRRRSWTVALVAVVWLTTLAWTVAMPLMVQPDEPSQLARAASLYRGEILTHQLARTPIGAFPVVRIPAALARYAPYARCVDLRPRRVPACAHLLTLKSGSARALTQFVPYPPAYFAVVGWPTAVLSGAAAAWGVRITSSLLSAVLITAALLFARRGVVSRASLLGVGLALTPLAWSTTGTVSNSSVEISGALAMWAGLAALADPRVRVDGRLALGVGSVCAVVMNARPLSPLYVAVAVAACAASSTRARLAELAAERAVRWAALLVAASGGVYLAWLGYAGRPALLVSQRHHPSMLAAFPLALGASWARVRGTLAAGLGTAVDPLVLVLWALAALALTLAVGSQLPAARPGRRALQILAVVVILLPPLIEASQVPAAGFWWQPRYELPFLVGLPILAARFFPAGPGWRVVGAAGLLASAAGSVAAFGFAVRSYSPAGWQPLGGADAAMGLYLVLTVALWALVLGPAPKAPSPPMGAPSFDVNNRLPAVRTRSPTT
ncbi:MAG: DUF2142 domain-containing protein [Mycobacteriales bacterium]